MINEKTVYTLSVVEGKTVLAPSRPISTKKELDLVDIGDGILDDVVQFPKFKERWCLPDGREFQQMTCAPYPASQIHRSQAIYIWERIR